jgi:hypothetical protein
MLKGMSNPTDRRQIHAQKSSSLVSVQIGDCPSSFGLAVHLPTFRASIQ